MISSFLLMGQSNMAGRGILTKENTIYNPKILKLINGVWRTMFEPVHWDRAFSGASLAPSFALEHLKYSNDDVGLIPVADGGTSISEWQKGEPLYENAVNMARLAMRESKIKAILWHQGEADYAPDRAEKYEERFIKMFEDIKKDLNLPDIKIYVGGLGDFLVNFAYKDPNCVNYTQINKILEDLSKKRDDVRFVSAKGLTSKDDFLHFNTEALRELGRRYFNEYVKDYPFAEKSDNNAEYISEEEKLALMKQKLEKGEISLKEYNEFAIKYMQTL